MKAIKIYLAIVTVLLCIAIGLGIYVWYTVQKLNTVTNATLEAGPTTTVSADSEGLILKKPIIVDITKLPATQQKVIETVGYKQDTFTITQGMVTCAESAVGVNRLKEIMNGATPSAFESIKLLPCLK